MEITWTGIDPWIEAGAGEAYHFTYNGEDYFVECWSTESSGGRDIYRTDTKDAASLWETAEEDDEFFEQLERVQTAFGEAYGDLVQPVMNQAIAGVLERVNREEG